MRKITSVQNPEIKSLVKLSTLKGRREQQSFIAEGVRVITTFLENGIEPFGVYATDAMVDALANINKNLLTLVSPPVMKKISQSKTPSGILAVFPIPTEPDLNQLDSGIILYEVSDPGNAGTLIRTSAAMNKETIIFVGGVDPWSPKVIQSAAGAHALTKIFQLDWLTVIEHKKHLKIAALVVTGGQSADKIDFSDTLLVIGSEAHGIPDTVLKACNNLITLEMPGKTESLNAAVAGSIALYITWLSTKLR